MGCTALEEAPGSRMRLRGGGISPIARPAETMVCSEPELDEALWAGLPPTAVAQCHCSAHTPSHSARRRALSWILGSGDDGRAEPPDRPPRGARRVDAGDLGPAR